MSSPATQASLRMQMIVVSCGVTFHWFGVFSFVYMVSKVCFALVPFDSFGAGFFVFVQTPSYDTIEEITLLHEIQIEEALRWMVEARTFVVAFFFLLLRASRRASVSSRRHRLVFILVAPPMSL